MSEKESVISIEKLRELIAYDAATGLLAWSLAPENGRKAGRSITGLNDAGYIMLRFGSVLLRGHRVAWAIQSGNWPTSHIDHINGKRDDNRWSNLRDVPHAANMRNRKSHPILVAAVRDASGAWDARIHRFGTVESLGLFGSQTQANDAWLEAKRHVKNPNRPRPSLRLPVTRK